MLEKFVIITLRNQALKAYFNKLQNTDTEKKKLWKTFRLLFSQKSNELAKKSHLKNKMKPYLMNAKSPEIFMEYFNNVTETINEINNDNMGEIC